MLGFKLLVTRSFIGAYANNFCAKFSDVITRVT